MDKTISEEEVHRRLLVCATYSYLLSAARHHGSLQTSYRIMASSWLLATFVAIGFLISADAILPFDHLLGVAIICILGIIGLFLLWYEDTFVQELLIDINVVEALRLESQNSWLPQLHHCFLHLHSKTNARVVKVVFFVGCKSILFTIMAIFLGIYFYKYNLHLMFITILACLLLNILSSHFMIGKAGKIQKLMEYLHRVDEKQW